MILFDDPMMLQNGHQLSIGCPRIFQCSHKILVSQYSVLSRIRFVKNALETRKRLSDHFFFGICVSKLIEIKAAALRTLTSIVHFDCPPRLSSIIDATGSSEYHGFLPTLIRNCIQGMISRVSKPLSLQI